MTPLCSRQAIRRLTTLKVSPGRNLSNISSTTARPTSASIKLSAYAKVPNHLGSGPTEMKRVFLQAKGHRKTDVVVTDTGINQQSSQLRALLFTLASTCVKSIGSLGRAQSLHHGDRLDSKVAGMAYQEGRDEAAAILRIHQTLVSRCSHSRQISQPARRTFRATTPARHKLMITYNLRSKDWRLLISSARDTV